MSEQQKDYGNGPTKEDFFEDLADYEEARFNMARAASLAGKAIASWEKKGGDPNDMRDGYSLRRMTPDQQQAELRRQFRVAGWMSMIEEDTIGQKSFAKLFDVKPVEKLGIGGAPLGTRLSIGRAMAAGHNEGKMKNGPMMQEGLAPYLEEYGWEPDSDEALAYCEGWGDGNKERPAPKPPREKPSRSVNEPVAEELEAQAKAEAAQAKLQAGQKKAAPKGAAKPRKGETLALPAPEAGVTEEPPGPIH